VRSPESLPIELAPRDGLTLIRASLLDLGDADLIEQVRGCSAVASCLGHNLSFRGVFGPPRRLVTDATRRLCTAIRRAQSEDPIKYVLMNTAGNRNRDLSEPVSFAQHAVVGMIRLLLPPQGDNEQAADYLRTEVGGRDAMIEWSVVRPDSLIDEEEVGPYEVHPSPIRSAIFNPGRTRRINVADFMARLITEPATWERWKGQMPVIYDTDA
jgi:hypothetical protein